jgi:hypothetical protein
MWVILFYPLWSPRCRRIRKTQAVSRNTQPNNQKTGAAWEQDYPYPECFEEVD